MCTWDKVAASSEINCFTLLFAGVSGEETDTGKVSYLLHHALHLNALAVQQVSILAQHTGPMMRPGYAGYVSVLQDCVSEKHAEKHPSQTHTTVKCGEKVVNEITREQFWPWPAMTVKNCFRNILFLCCLHERSRGGVNIDVLACCASEYAS